MDRVDCQYKVVGLNIGIASTADLSRDKMIANSMASVRISKSLTLD
jgi:hypothetical protein